MTLPYLQLHPEPSRYTTFKFSRSISCILHKSYYNIQTAITCRRSEILQYKLILSGISIPLAKKEMSFLSTGPAILYIPNTHRSDLLAPRSLAQTSSIRHRYNSINTPLQSKNSSYDSLNFKMRCYIALSFETYNQPTSNQDQIRVQFTFIISGHRSQALNRSTASLFSSSSTYPLFTNGAKTLQLVLALKYSMEA